jgi:hypothetical protein
MYAHNLHTKAAGEKSEQRKNKPRYNPGNSKQMRNIQEKPTDYVHESRSAQLLSEYGTYIPHYRDLSKVATLDRASLVTVLSVKSKLV